MHLRRSAVARANKSSWRRTSDISCFALRAVLYLYAPLSGEIMALSRRTSTVNHDSRFVRIINYAPGLLHSEKLPGQLRLQILA